MQKIVGETWTPKYMAYFAPILMMAMMINQFMNLKVINLFGLPVLASVLTYPISLMIGDLLTEVYGYKRTRWLICVCLLLIVVTMGFIQLAVYWPPAADYKYNEIYKTLFKQLPNLALATIVGYLTGELLNAFVMSRLKSKAGGRFFYFRALASTAFSQIICGFIFFLVAFGTTMSVKIMVSSTLTAVALNLAYEVFFLTFTTMAVRKLKSLEGVDYYDR